MATTTEYSWVPVYEKLATALLAHEGNRTPLLNALMAEFEARGLFPPRWSDQGTPRDIDPFTLFGAFNRTMAGANRTAYAHAIGSVLQVDTSALTDFCGIPVLNSQKAAFYGWDVQGDNSSPNIDNLWKLFKSALQLADSPSAVAEQQFTELFNAAETQLYVHWNLTMGLYWMRPHTFVNLDTLNRKYLAGIEDFRSYIARFNTVPDGTTYLQLCKACRAWVQSAATPCNSIPEISQQAYKTWQEGPRPSYWAMPCKDSDGTEYWDECFHHGKMILGYGQIGDIARFASKEKLTEELNRLYKTDFSASSRWPGWLWKFAHQIKPGDIIYAKSGTRSIRGVGRVTAGYRYTDTPLTEHFNHELSIDWLRTETFTVQDEGEIFGRMQTLQSLGLDKQCLLEQIYPVPPEENAPAEQPSAPIAPDPAARYSKEDFLREVFVSPAELNRMLAVLDYKSNLILQGAPGVGKSFLAKRLAYAYAGEKADACIRMVQFHHSYSYEEFIEGFRPGKNGEFVLTRGSFYNFCKQAGENPNRPHFYIIDEINRGDLNKIFGEAFLLLEKDKRGQQIQLLYSKEMFTIPANVHLIGMMNTADHNIALMDHALHRRFGFIDIPPAFSRDGFRRHIGYAPATRLTAILNLVENLNADITEDTALGKGYRIGHSYFCPANPAELTDERLQLIVEFELIPLLAEYWCEEPQKAQEWSDKLRDAVQLP